MSTFFRIETRTELAELLEIKPRNLTYILYVKGTENCYNSFTIPKKNGGERKIDAPDERLKSIQRKLADLLWKRQQEIWEFRGIVPRISHAFEKGKGIISNAKIHRNKRYVLNFDLENFFGSFHFGRVRGFFQKNKWFKCSTEVATIIAQLCCYQGVLPQGAPTSPIITNLICQVLDQHLLRVARKYGLNYTRYADDLTFSTNRKDFLEYQEDFIAEIKRELKIAGFRMNEAKTRIQFKNSRQMVTGLVVNKKINVNNTYCRMTRAMAQNQYMYDEFYIDGKKGTLEQLEGRFAFIDQLDKYNNGLNDEQHEVNTLNVRESAYKKFLFYKIFYHNEHPLIVTEGKTDICYIKCALKSLYKEYPELIELDENEKFRYKVSFLKRTERIQQFLGIRLDGADTIGNIYRYYTDSKDAAFPDYYHYFLKFGNKPHMPVILLFDNEIGPKERKPLKKFIQFYKISQDKEAELKKQLYCRLQDDANIFLCTNPLIGNKAECEIEELFPAEVLSVELGGKKFSRASKPDNTRFYGKEIFSKYIEQNYKEIDFSGFRGLLDAIREVVRVYS